MQLAVPTHLQDNPGPHHYNLQNYRSTGAAIPSKQKDPTQVLAEKVKKVKEKYDPRRRVLGCTYDAEILRQLSRQNKHHQWSREDGKVRGRAKYLKRAQSTGLIGAVAPGASEAAKAASMVHVVERRRLNLKKQSDNVVGQECDPNEIILDPLAVMKREMAGGLAVEQDKMSLSVVPKIGGAQAQGFGAKRPGGGHVGIVGLGSLMGLQG